jgi:hypothetical protein
MPPILYLPTFFFLRNNHYTSEVDEHSQSQWTSQNCFAWQKAAAQLILKWQSDVQLKQWAVIKEFLVSEGECIHKYLLSVL